MAQKTCCNAVVSKTPSFVIENHFVLATTCRPELANSLQSPIWFGKFKMPPKPQKQVEEDMYSDMSDELDDTEYDEAEDYRPKNVLKAPRNVQYSIHTLYGASSLV